MANLIGDSGLRHIPEIKKLRQIANAYGRKYKDDLGLLSVLLKGRTEIPCWIKVIAKFVADFKTTGDLEALKSFTSTLTEFYDEVLKEETPWSHQDDTLLHWAINEKRVDFIRTLPLELINMFEGFGENAFSLAVRRKNLEVVKILLDFAQDWSDTDNDSDYTDISSDDSDDFDDYFNDFETGEVKNNFLNFTEWGKRVPGYTPFLHTCEQEKTDILELLLEKSEIKGIKIHQTLQNGMTALHVASKPNYDKWSRTKIEVDKANALEVLLKHVDTKNFNIFARDDDGLTPFEVACRYGATKAFKIWLNYFEEKGIEINEKGMTPLVAVCMKTEVFGEYGGDDWDTWHDSTYESRTEIAKILVKMYEDKGLDMKADETALHHACSSGSLEIVKLLLDHGFGDKINAQDSDGRTPLHLACSMLHEYWEESPSGYPDVVELLLSKKDELGLDPTIQDDRKLTAFKAIEQSDEMLDKKAVSDVFAKYGITE